VKTIIVLIITTCAVNFGMLWESAFNKKRYRKTKIIICCLIAVVGSIIYSYFFDEYFISKEIVNTCLEILRYK
jgi:hypothetical protein